MKNNLTRMVALALTAVLTAMLMLGGAGAETLCGAVQYDPCLLYTSRVAWAPWHVLLTDVCLCDGFPAPWVYYNIVQKQLQCHMLPAFARFGHQRGQNGNLFHISGLLGRMSAPPQ